MDSKGQAKPAANLLREGLRGAAEACPDPEILAAYTERSLDADETARWEFHFSQCSDCREQLAAIGRASEGEAALANAKSSRWAWLWDWRMLAPVAAMLIVGAIWIEHRPAPIVGEDHALVAMSSQKLSPAAPTQQERTREYSAAPAPPPKVATPALSVNPNQQIDALRKQSQPPSAPRPADEKKDANLAGAMKNADSLKESASSNAVERDAESSSAKAKSMALPASPPPSPGIANGNGAGLGAGTASGVAGGPPAPKSSNEPTSVESETNSLEPTVAAANSRATATTTKARAKVAYSPALAQMAVLSAATIATPDPMVQWRIGEAGFVERTTNGGNSWQGQQPEQNAQLVAGSAPSTKICWLVGNGGVILITKDAEKWRRVSPPVAADFTGVVARSERSATVTTSDGHSFITNDAGDHWLPEQK